MDIEKLVDMVVKEVMNRIPGSLNDNATEKEKVLVISSCKEDLTMVEELLEHKYQVNIYNEADINLRNYQHIIVTNLCNKGLSSMALGLCNDNVQEFIVDALLGGKKVSILKEGIQYRKYLSTTNKELYNLYNQYECKIMSYGVAIVHKKDLLKNIDGKIEEKVNTNISENTMQSHQVVEISNKRLITESDLKKLYLHGIKEVNVIKKAILTPLAQDYVRIKRLQINRIVRN